MTLAAHGGPPVDPTTAATPPLRGTLQRLLRFWALRQRRAHRLAPEVFRPGARSFHPLQVCVHLHQA